MASGPPTKKLRNGLLGYLSYVECGAPLPKSTLFDRQKREQLKTVNAADSQTDQDDSIVSSLGSPPERSFSSRQHDAELPRDGDAMLYPGARITRRESIISILNLINRHPAVNKETVRDVLGTVRAHLPKGINVPHVESMYKFCKVKKQCIKGAGPYEPSLLIIENRLDALEALKPQVHDWQKRIDKTDKMLEAMGKLEKENSLAFSKLMEKLDERNGVTPNSLAFSKIMEKLDERNGVTPTSASPPLLSSLTATTPSTPPQSAAANVQAKQAHGLIPPTFLQAALSMACARKATKVLLMKMFGWEVIATHTFRQTHGKQQLNPQITEAIIGPSFGISGSMRRSGSLGNLGTKRGTSNLAPTFNTVKDMQGTQRSSVTTTYSSGNLEAEYIKNLQQQIYFLELEANYLRDQARKATDLQPRMTDEATRMLSRLEELRSDVDSLHLEVQRKESNLDFVNLEKERLDSKLKLLAENHSREKRLLVEDIVQLKKQSEMVQREMSDKESQIIFAKDELDKSSMSLNNAKHQIQILKAQVDQKSECLKKTQLALEEKRTDLLKSQTQYQELEEKYYSSTASIQDMAVQDIRDQVRVLQQKLKEAELTAEQDRFMKNKMSDDVNNLVKENAMLGTQVLELQKQLERERSLRETRDTRHTSSITEVVTLKDKEKQLKFELDQAKDDLNQEKDRVKHLMEQLVRQEQLNTRSSLSHNTTRSRLAEIEARHVATEQENAQLRRDKMLLVDHVSDLQKQIAEKKEELTGTTSTFHTLNNQLKIAEQRTQLESSMQLQKWSEFEKMAESMKKLSQSMTARSHRPDYS